MGHKIRVIVILMFCMLVGCSKVEEQNKMTVENSRVEADREDAGLGKAEYTEARNTVENGVEQNKISEGLEPEVLQYPRLLAPTLTSNIDFAIESEDIFCIYNGEKYGYMKESGEEITDYIYESAFPFTEGLACVILDGKYGVIDTDGKEVIPFIYDEVTPFMEGLAYFSMGEEYGFMTRDGEVAFYLDCDSVSSFQEGFAYFSIDGRYGYIDKKGEIVIAPEYSDADYFEGGIAFINIDGNKGAINSKGEIVIPVEYDNIYRSDGYIIAKCGEVEIYYTLSGESASQKEYEKSTYIENEDSDTEMLRKELEGIYDYVGLFRNERAIVCKGERYGIVDKDGGLLVPLEYDYVSLFEDGSYCLEKDNMFLYNNQQELIYKVSSGFVYMEEDFYRIEMDDNLILLSKDGEVILTANCDYNANVIYKDKQNSVLRQYDVGEKDQILLMKDSKDIDLSGLLLKNSITPRIKQYWELTHGISVNAIDVDKELTETKRFYSWGEYEYNKKARLYDIEQSGIPILFCYEEAAIRSNFPMSDSALYTIKDKQLHCLVTGYECGGSMRGDYVCFWKEADTGRVMIGCNGAAGGFGGFSTYSAIYDFETENVKRVQATQYVNQTTSNYEQKILIENASLFYNEENVPFTETTIQKAEVVSEYSVNENRVTIEEYEQACRRYQYFELFY